MYEGSVVRLETMIAAQSNSLQKLRHQWVGSPSATLRLEASVEDSIATSMLTLQHIRQCAMTFEACWAILDTVAAPGIIDPIMGTNRIQIRRLIANPMSASPPIEEYLRQGRPLTAQEFDSLSLTISGLQTFLDIWRRTTDVTASSNKS